MASDKEKPSAQPGGTTPKVDPKTVQSVNQLLQEQLRIMTQLNEAVLKMSQNLRAIDEREATGNLSAEHWAEVEKHIDRVNEKAEGATGVFDGLGKALTGPLSLGLGILATGFEKITGFLKGVVAISGQVLGFFGDLAVGLFNIGAAIVSIPFKLLDGLFGLANKYKGDNSLAVALQGIVKQFGALSSVGSKAIVNIRTRLNEFAADGKGAMRVWGTLAEQTEAVKNLATAMGPQFEADTAYFEKNGVLLMRFQKGLGLAEEDIGNVTRSSKRMGKDAVRVLTDMTKYSQALGKSFSMDAKVLGRDMVKALGDTAHWGHLVDKELAVAATYANKLGISMDKLTGVMDLTLTYDQTAEAVAKINEQFNTHIDTMELLEKENAGDILDVYRRELLAVGKDMSNLDWRTKNFIKTTLSMDDATFDAAFAAKNQAITMKSVRAEADKVSASTMSAGEAMKELAKDIEVIVPPIAEVKKLWDSITDGIDRSFRLWPTFRKLIDNIVAVSREAIRFGKIIGDLIQKLPGVEDFVGGLADLMSPATWGKLFGGIEKALQDFADRGYKNIDQLMTDVSNSFESFWGDSTPGALRVWKGMNKFFDFMLKLIEDSLAWCIRKIAGGIDWLTDTFATGIPKVLAWIKDPTKKFDLGLKAPGTINSWTKIFDPLFPAIDNFTKKAWPEIKKMLTYLTDKMIGYLKDVLFDWKTWAFLGLPTLANTIISSIATSRALKSIGTTLSSTISSSMTTSMAAACANPCGGAIGTAGKVAASAAPAAASAGTGAANAAANAAMLAPAVVPARGASTAAATKGLSKAAQQAAVREAMKPGGAQRAINKHLASTLTAGFGPSKAAIQSVEKAVEKNMVAQAVVTAEKAAAQTAAQAGAQVIAAEGATIATGGGTAAATAGLLGIPVAGWIVAGLIAAAVGAWAIWSSSKQNELKQSVARVEFAETVDLINDKSVDAKDKLQQLRRTQIELLKSAEDASSMWAALRFTGKGGQSDTERLFLAQAKQVEEATKKLEESLKDPNSEAFKKRVEEENERERKSREKLIKDAMLAQMGMEDGKPLDMESIRKNMDAIDIFYKDVLSKDIQGKIEQIRSKFDSIDWKIIGPEKEVDMKAAAVNSAFIVDFFKNIVETSTKIEDATLAAAKIVSVLAQKDGAFLKIFGNDEADQQRALLRKIVKVAMGTFFNIEGMDKAKGDAEKVQSFFVSITSMGTDIKTMSMNFAEGIKQLDTDKVFTKDGAFTTAMTRLMESFDEYDTDNLENFVDDVAPELISASEKITELFSNLKEAIANLGAIDGNTIITMHSVLNGIVDMIIAAAAPRPGGVDISTAVDTLSTAYTKIQTIFTNLKETIDVAGNINFAGVSSMEAILNESVRTLSAVVDAMQPTFVTGVENLFMVIDQMVQKTQAINKALSNLPSFNLAAKLQPIAQGMGFGGKYAYSITGADVTVNIDLNVQINADDLERAVVMRRTSIIRDRLNFAMQNSTNTENVDKYLFKTIESPEPGPYASTNVP